MYNVFLLFIFIIEFSFNLTNDKKNLLISAITKYSWDIIKLYYISMIKADFENVDVVVYYGNITQEAINKLNSFGIITYPIPEEYLNSKINVLPQYRFKLYELYLKENKDKYNMVFTADVRDAIFQKDVFKFYNYSKPFLGIFLEEKTLRQEINRGWILQFIDQKEYNSGIADKRIICSGSLMGTVDKFMEFCTVLWDTVKNRSVSLDQGATNYLIYSKKLFDGYLVRTDNHGPVMTIGDSVRSNIKLYNNDTILN